MKMRSKIEEWSLKGSGICGLLMMLLLLSTLKMSQEQEEEGSQTISSDLESLLDELHETYQKDNEGQNEKNGGNDQWGTEEGAEHTPLSVVILNKNHASRRHNKEHKFPVIRVRTPLGQITGRQFHLGIGVKAAGFLGIPYAKPPLGSLRFMPPVRLNKWKNGELMATNFGPICIQPSEQRIWDMVFRKKKGLSISKRKLKSYVMSEDCLTLNIYVPLSDSGELDASNLPVFLFIHGGSYYMNSGRLYHGQMLASKENLVVVTFNYRLGPLGFLSTGDSVAPGNYGLLDQVAALDWVRDHIKNFGGDPNAVTLVGNSAGAASVMFLMFSNMAKGKFVRATVQSGCSGAPWAIQRTPTKHTKRLAESLDCPTYPSNETIECIRKVPGKKIMEHANLEDGLSLAYATVIDGNYGGTFLTDYPENLIAKKDFYSVPILTGFTKDEVSIWFTKMGSKMETKDLKAFVQLDVVSLMKDYSQVTDASMAAMIHSVTVQYLYRGGMSENDTYGRTRSISDFISDVGLKAPCVNEMNLLSKHSKAPVYLYEFQYNSVDDTRVKGQDWIGAYHESELQFIFGETFFNYSNHLRAYDDKRISNLMMSLWGNFARHGNPTPKEIRINAQSSFLWKNYTELSQDYAAIGMKTHVETSYLTDRMLFWNFFFPIFRDYNFRYALPHECKTWDILQDSWIFWILVAMISSFALVLLILILSINFGRKAYFTRSRRVTISSDSSSSNNSQTNNHTRHHHRLNHRSHSNHNDLNSRNNNNNQHHISTSLSTDSAGVRQTELHSNSVGLIS